MSFKNDYEDVKRAQSYARLEFPGTYYLAFRDIPSLIDKHVSKGTALDFGCGTGRSSRYLKKLGFETIGVDISREMLTIANELDNSGQYFLVPDGDLSCLDANQFDMIFSSFTFDNIPSIENKIKLFSQFKKLLDEDGKIISIVSTPDMYLNEWHSFSTKDYPENRHAKSGDVVRIITTAVEDKRPVEDILMTDDAYRGVYKKADLMVIEMLKPLAYDHEPYEWVNETRIAPWAIYALGA